MSVFSPGLLQLYPTNVLKSSQLAKSGPLPEIQSLSLSTQPPFVPGQQCEQLLTSDVWQLSLWWVLCFPSVPRHCVPLWGSETAPHSPQPSMGVSSMWKLFLLPSSLPRAQIPLTENPFSFLTFIFWPTHYSKTLTLFESLGLPYQAFRKVFFRSCPYVDVFWCCCRRESDFLILFYPVLEVLICLLKNCYW